MNIKFYTNDLCSGGIYQVDGAVGRATITISLNIIKFLRVERGGAPSHIYITGISPILVYHSIETLTYTKTSSRVQINSSLAKLLN